jgi:radical SAM superfamily enzyme YgiQ (UPF0313 family)
MFFCQNCNNSLDITKNTNVKKVDKIVINTPEEFIKLYNNTNTQNHYLNFNEDSLKLYLKKEDIRNEGYTNIINSFYKILNNQMSNEEKAKFCTEVIDTSDKIENTYAKYSELYKKLAKKFNWPLEPESGWGPPGVATIMTSRVCPWQCVFCNENSYIPNMGRRPVEMVIEELNRLHVDHGPVGSVVIHDSMFFQNPSWLEEWVDKYPRMAKQVWPYWAAGRADTVRQWPDLFEAVIRKTNWNTVSIGFESGSDRTLRILNKECTEEDNYFAIDLLTRIGDEMEAEGKKAPVFWSNIMLGIPGESHEDAFKTMRMVKYTKRIMPSISFYAPYPGSALGNQLIAEGKSRMTKENYHRFPDDEKVVGIDYQFYRELLAGKYDAEVNRGLVTVRQERKNYRDALIKA